MSEATGRSGHAMGADTPIVAGALVIGALLALLLMNRIVANVHVGVK